jgi:hypothetical protein
MARSWSGDGPEFDIAWGGRSWTLKVDGPRPGLRTSGPDAGPVLSLEGVAAPGRWDADAFSGATLVGFERRFERIEATYGPPGWGDLSIRAAWSPSGSGDEGIDLEIQLSAQSVGELKALEVKLASVLPELSKSSGRRKRWVEPRDARSARFSYDGREPDIHGLTTLPIPDDDRLAPRVLPAPWPGGASYVEIAHPHDVARRIAETIKIGTVGHTTRYGLFGHDLEKGVVLRGRLRGLWLISSTPEREALERYDEFLREPPPLGT